jgi:hypothetical protein
MAAAALRAMLTTTTLDGSRQVYTVVATRIILQVCIVHVLGYYVHFLTHHDTTRIILYYDKEG